VHQIPRAMCPFFVARACDFVFFDSTSNEHQNGV
jgi:hypothetical protein